MVRKPVSILINVKLELTGTVLLSQFSGLRNVRPNAESPLELYTRHHG
jgi:hypothetical protein